MRSVGHSWTEEKFNIYNHHFNSVLDYDVDHTLFCGVGSRGIRLLQAHSRIRLHEMIRVSAFT